MVLIGLMGLKSSGKTTLAGLLVKDYGFMEKPFAECLKNACKSLFLLNDNQLNGTQLEKETPDPRWYGCTPRKMLQYVGTELLRDNLDNIMPGLGKNVFTNHFKLWYEAELAKNPDLKVVVSDVRFRNEVDFIKNLGGTVIKINRESVVTNDLHPSEVEMQNIKDYEYDYDIYNNGKITDLYDQLYYFFEVIDN